MPGFDDPEDWDQFWEEPVADLDVGFLHDEVDVPPELLPSVAAAVVAPPAAVVPLSPPAAVDAVLVPVLPESLSPGSEPARKRLRTKQAVPGLSPSSSSQSSSSDRTTDGDGDGARVVRWSDATSRWEGMAHRHKWLWVYRKFQYWLKKALEDVDHGEGANEEEQSILRVGGQKWARAPRSEKNKVIHIFLQRSAAPECVLEFAAEAWPEAAESGAWLYSRTILFTWQGPWGEVDLPTDLRQRAIGESLSPSYLEDVVEYLRKDADVMGTWERFQKHSAKLEVFLQCEEVGLSFEVCTRTLQEAGKVRVHAHGFYKKNGKMYLASKTPAVFEGSVPNKSCSFMGTQTNRGSGGFAGLYYVLAPKLGSVFTACEQQPYRDFPVSPEWIFNLVQAEKMEYTEARRELVRCGKGLVRRLGDLERWKQARCQLRLEKKVQRVQDVIRSRDCTFRSLPRVDAWLRKYSSHEQNIMDRKKLLVLAGPTGVGKTKYVRSLFKRNEVLELNAANLQCMCIPGFDPEVHRCILWDEARAKLIAENRKVFQMPAAFVDIGHSPTGRDIVHVYLNDAVSIVCSNKWEEDVAALSEGDRAWVEANTIVVTVTTPLWNA